MIGNILLSAEVRAGIDRWLQKYPPDKKRSAVIEALRLTQEQNNGYLTTELMNAVAVYLELPVMAVYEVATFYSMFHLKPVGRHELNLCTNISCTLNGAKDIGHYLKKKLNIDFNETTPDGKFTLKAVECLGACANAPVIHLGKKYIENLTPEKIDALLESLHDQ